MGCVESKNSVQGRISKYRIAAYEEFKGLKLAPLPLEAEWENNKGRVSTRQFHNIFYDGFYAPYMTNQDYLLLIDCRDEVTFLEEHILTARWHGTIPLEENLSELSKYIHIILYDQDGTGISDRSSQLNKTFESLKALKLDPVCLDAGIEDAERHAFYMVTGDSIILQEQHAALNWFPSIIDDCLWQGRIEQGANTLVLKTLNITHLLTVGETRPALALPGMTCLTIHWNENTKEEQILKTVKGAVAFIRKARREDGSILVLGDQGVNRSATVVMAYLMTAKQACLEDVFYYVRGLKPATQPNQTHLQILSMLECDIFGKKITQTEDLW